MEKKSAYFVFVFNGGKNDIKAKKSLLFSVRTFATLF